MDENIITFTDENGEEEQYYVVDETRVNDVNYLLVCESMEAETDAYILKDVSSKEDLEAVYVFVEDDEELSLVADIFEQLLGEDEQLV